MITKTLSTAPVLGLLLIMTIGASSCCSPSEGFSEKELALIESTDSIMRVLTVEDSLDNAVLRAPSKDFSIEALRSETFAELERLMVATVTHPSQDGVGIAGPQVGLNRRVVAVQRFDKGATGTDGEMEYPFEVYPNIRIIWASDSLSAGPEGCLSVPGRRGDVLRSQEIVVEYADMTSIRDTSCEDIPMIRDTVRGFTAVIFQHEIDHLEGVLYIDRL
jgi:peptide deformylase